MWMIKQPLLGQVASKWDPGDQSKQTTVYKGIEEGEGQTDRFRQTRQKNWLEQEDWKADKTRLGAIWS